MKMNTRKQLKHMLTIVVKGDAIKITGDIGRVLINGSFKVKGWTISGKCCRIKGIRSRLEYTLGEVRVFCEVRGWDDAIPEIYRMEWIDFFSDLFNMEMISFPRYIKPEEAVEQQ